MEYQDRLFNQKNRASMDKIINNLPGGIIVFEMQENKIKTLFSNDGTYQLFGYSKEAFKTVFHSDVFEIVYQPDLAPLQEEFYEATKNRESFEHGCRCFRNDGTLMWTYFRVNYIGTEDGRNVFVGLITDSSKERLLEEKSRINEEMYHIAFNQSNVFLLEYDHRSKQVSCSSESSAAYFDSAAFSNIPESLIDSDLIHERSFDDFYHFYHQIIGGVKTGEVKLKMRALNSDKYIWIHVKFTNIFDDDNQPIKAVGVYQNIDEQVRLESRYLQEIKYRQKLMQRSITNLEVNLTTDEVIKAHNVTYNLLGLDEKASYSEFIKKMVTLVADEDKHLFLDTFGLDNVRQAYHDGKDDLRISFLFYRPTKKRYGWVSTHMMVLYNEETNQLMGFFYANDIDDDKRKTIELTRQARTDALTGLINRRELERVITSEIQLVEPGNYGALFMIDVDNFKLVNDANGHSAGDETLRFVANRLKSLFRGDDVVGRFGGDEFMVYMKEVGAKKDVISKAKQVSEALATTCPGSKIDISCSVGVTFVETPRVIFDEIYHQADSAAYEAKKNGKKSYHIFE